MDGSKPNTEEATIHQTSVPAVSISFYLSSEEESSHVSVQEMRDILRENNQAVSRVDKSLYTLKNNLMTLRDQDLQLLKQLIQIGDTIRKLSRCHDRRPGSKRAARASFRSTQELMSSAVDLSVTLRRSKGQRTTTGSSSLFSAAHVTTAAVAAAGAGDYSTVPLVRRQSEPQMCGLTPRAAAAEMGGGISSSGDVRSWGSRRGSGSSTEWWSEDTLGSSEDGLDILGSEDAATRDRGDSNLAPSDDTNPPTSTTATAIFADSSPPTLRTEDPEANSAEMERDMFLHRPKSHSVVAATFLNRPKLSGGNSTYSTILTQNVRLWKDRLENANNVRQRIAILEEESQES